MELGFLQFATREAIMLLRSFVATALVLFGCFTAAPASAHFKLLKPASWLKEDSTGGPQKGSPCGPGGTGFLGDDVQPIPTSGMVTEFKAGEEIEIEIDETIPHQGYWRIAFAKDRSEFTIPPVDNPTSCALDLSKVPTGAHDNILADGLWKEETQPAARKLSTKVKLPNEPCEKCTIQVVQVMKDHGLSSCYYYHCADIKIVAAGAATGTAGTTAAGSGGAAAGTGAAGTGAAAGAGGSVATAGAGASGAAGTPAASTAGTAAAAGTSGAAGRASSAAGSVAAPSGSAGTPSASSAAGQGTTSSPQTAAGAAATAGAMPPATPVESSGCAVASRPSANGLGVRAGLALFAVAFLFRVRRRRSSRVGRADA